MENVFKLLANLQRKPQFISADVTKVQHLSPEEKNTLQRIGISMSQLRASMTLETQVNYDRARFYQEVTRAMENALVGASLELYAEYACLTGDTKIPLLDGRTLTIKDILDEYNQGKELWIYSCTNEGKPKPSKILKAIKQEHKPKTFRVWLDNGKYIEASDNHRFIKRDGSLCRTDELKIDDSLMPFHRFVPEDGYERVWNILKGNWDSTYKMVAESVNNINLEEYNKGRSLKDGVGTYLVVHHDNFIKEDNSPSNLKLMTDAEHIYLHSKVLIERWQDSIWREMMIQKNIESHNTPKYLEELIPSYNHKIVKIEYIGEQEVYDISVSGSELFGLDCGIYIHNTNYNHLHNASVWITSESSTYQRQLTDLLDRIGLEEKIFDWAWSTGGFGDLFVKMNGAPGLGIVSIEDDDHPLNMSRIDHEGILIGFYNTPQGQSTEEQIKPPWSHVHFRLLGAKRKRPMFGDPLYAEFRTIHLMTGTDTKSITSKYGTSLLVNALPIWKRLRMAEDSLLLARLTRGIIRYIWKMKVNGGNAEAVAALMDEFSSLLKRARAVDNRSGSPYYDDKEQPMGCLSGNTELRLCNGKNVSIKDIVENKVDYIGKSIWSINPETLHIEAKQIIGANKTRLNAQLVRVHLDNGKYVDCTPDHKFMLRDGSYKEAKDLQSDESLMPFYTKILENKKGVFGGGYECIYDPADNEYHFAHKIVTGKIKRGYLVHHNGKTEEGNWNKLDNDPMSLVWPITREEHSKYYHKKHTKEAIKKIINNQVAWLKDETKETCEYLKYLSGCFRNRVSKFWSSEKGKLLLKKLGTNLVKNGKDHFCYGKTWVEILGQDRAKIRKQEMIKRISGDNNPSKRPEVRKKISKSLTKIKCFRTKFCKCGCSGQFKEDLSLPQQYIHGHNRSKKYVNVLNHKVVKVEWLLNKQDTYDITVKDNHNFSLSNGIIVHNSMEDIFIPVWGDNVNDLSYDKIGGEADIRWIVDITDLRDQLAKALRTPLVLLGGGSGDMGGLGDHSQAIEKLDIRFARSARRLQRSLKEGIKRMCQIHLAWQNMDPDPNLFDVNMSETSTAEEDELATALDKNVDVCMKMLDMLKAVDPEADQRKALDYLNMKILKLEDFKSDEFLSQVNTNTINKEKIMDAIKRDRRKPMYNMDVMGALPFQREILNGNVKRTKILEQCQEQWNTNFGKVMVREDKGVQHANLTESGQMNFKF